MDARNLIRHGWSHMADGAEAHYYREGQDEDGRPHLFSLCGLQDLPAECALRPSTAVLSCDCKDCAAERPKFITRIRLALVQK
jgi:hypothetical protein